MTSEIFAPNSVQALKKGIEPSEACFQNPRDLTILGATGSIGESCLRVVKAQPDAFRVRVVTGGRQVEKLAKIARETSAELAVIADESLGHALRDALAGTSTQVRAGDAALLEVAATPVDICVGAISGMAGIRPIFAAIPHIHALVLANKETLVAAGPLVMAEIHKHDCILLPADSEHNALFLALGGQTGRAAMQRVRRLILTASGGPFRTASLSDMRSATPQQALAHPNWSMGAKVTIDSATLFNKSLELIEAAYMFDARSEELDVLVHPTSVVHSLVEFEDRMMTAILGTPDMAGALSCCLNWPDRPEAPIQALDLTQAPLHFEAPNTEKFASLDLARQALKNGGSLPLVLNAANEAAVKLFLEGRLGFLGITDMVAQAMEGGDWTLSPSSVEEVCDMSYRVYQNCLSQCTK